VTVLFADLAGSTALGERLDPEDVRVLQGGLFELVNAEVERYGGVSEKFVGDAVLAVFGIPQTHEDDAERAVRAALAIQQAFPAFASAITARHGLDVSLRVGVNTGEVVAGRDGAARGELMVTGDAVNVAARLQQLATPGSVLVGERTRLATQRVVGYRDAQELEAKGKERPVRAFVAVEAIAEQRARGDGYSAPLIGRDDDLALLRLTAARVERERAPQLVTIFGHAGVGKSRLVDEFVHGLERGRVVIGRCVPYGDGITYLPLAQVASALAGIQDDDRMDMALTKLKASIERAVPAEQAGQVFEAVAWTMGLALPGRASGIGSLPRDVTHALHYAWSRYLAELGREELLVLVVDDVHWASGALLDLLEHVLDGIEDTAVLIFCPSRPEIVDTRPTWGTGRLNASSITLTPLGTADSQSLLEALLDAATVPAAVARAILEPAEGNPFFVEEMLSMLVERGALERVNRGWAATGELESLALPDSIHGVIAARIDLLEAPQREALRRCSVMGRVFWPSAVGVDDDLIAGLGRRAIASEQPASSFSGRREFAYKHALTHEVAYATLPRPERRELHRRVATWITEVVPDRRAETTELIAYHLEQALLHGEPDPELQRRAFDALLDAGDAAARRGAYTSAEGLLGRALDLVPAEDERARALLAAARVDVHTGRYERAIERLDGAIAAAAADPELRADALGVRSRANWLLGRGQDAFESSRAAAATLEGLPESDEFARALARLSQIEMLRSLPSAEATATHAIEVAQRVGEPAAEANARSNLFVARAAHGIVPPTSEIEEIVDLAVAAGAHDEAVRAVVNYTWTAATLGPTEPAERLVGEMRGRLTAGLAAEAYDQYLRLSVAALVYVPAGRWVEADATVAAGEALAVTNRLLWLWIVTGQALRRGQLDVVDRHLADFRETALATEEPQRIVPMAAVAIPRAVLNGRVEGVGDLADLVIPMIVKQSNWALGALAIARSLAVVGDRARLSALAASAAPECAPVPDLMSKVVRALLLSLEGDFDGAAPLMQVAERSAVELDRSYEAACIAGDLARVLEASGDAGGAEVAEARSRAMLEPLGCVNPY
jgi:class 3 adenylate cyclase/tetratricopeptide (TPR) repeat protein